MATKTLGVFPGMEKISDSNFEKKILLSGKKVLAVCGPAWKDSLRNFIHRILPPYIPRFYDYENFLFAMIETEGFTRRKQNPGTCKRFELETSSITILIFKNGILLSKTNLTDDVQQQQKCLVKLLEKVKRA